MEWWWHAEYEKGWREIESVVCEVAREVVIEEADEVRRSADNTWDLYFCVIVWWFKLS